MQWQSYVASDWSRIIRYYILYISIERGELYMSHEKLRDGELELVTHDASPGVCQWAMGLGMAD